jgi:hypothetical protein
MIMAFFVMHISQESVTKQIEAASYRAYRFLIHWILLLLVAFLLFGDRLDWAIGLTGIAWRAWLLLYTLPMWLALMARMPGDTE